MLESCQQKLINEFKEGLGEVEEDSNHDSDSYWIKFGRHFKQYDFVREFGRYMEQVQDSIWYEIFAEGFSDGFGTGEAAKREPLTMTYKLSNLMGQNLANEIDDKEYFKQETREILSRALTENEYDKVDEYLEDFGI